MFQKNLPVVCSRPSLTWLTASIRECLSSHFISYAFVITEAHYLHSLRFSVNSINFTMIKTFRHKAIALKANLNKKFNIFYSFSITFSTSYTDTHFVRGLDYT